VRGSRKKLDSLLHQFANAYDGTPWYGDSMQVILGQVTEDIAQWQPYKGAHSVAQIVWHMIYWRQSLIKRLEGDLEYRGSLKSEANWSTADKVKDIGWESLRKLLEDSQIKLTSLLSQQEDSLLDKPYTNKATFKELIEGILQHDLYHTGQIAYLKNLYSLK